MANIEKSLHCFVRCNLIITNNAICLHFHMENYIVGMIFVAGSRCQLCYVWCVFCCFHKHLVALTNSGGVPSKICLGTCDIGLPSLTLKMVDYALCLGDRTSDRCCCSPSCLVPGEKIPSTLNPGSYWWSLWRRNGLPSRSICFDDPEAFSSHA